MFCAGRVDGIAFFGVKIDMVPFKGVLQRSRYESAFVKLTDISHMPYARDHCEVLDFIGHQVVLTDVVRS